MCSRYFVAQRINVEQSCGPTLDLLSANGRRIYKSAQFSPLFLCNIWMCSLHILGLGNSSLFAKSMMLQSAWMLKYTVFSFYICISRLNMLTRKSGSIFFHTTGPRSKRNIKANAQLSNFRRLLG